MSPSVFRLVLTVVTLTLALSAGPLAAATYPILFVTQVPAPNDFTTIGSVFGNHLASVQSAPRGGDLYIRYVDGSLKNLTAAAGYGVVGFQGATSIAVREPAVHWSGTKAIFSMVIGAPTAQFQVLTHYWQLYEITGFGIGETPVITKVPNQPANVNNVSPIYASDGTIIFTSDRARNGAAHLRPQLDEYEEAATVSGLWHLDPASGALTLLDHAPSGDFKPIVDSYGRVIFTRWDHLQRDQQADADAVDGGEYGTFNWTNERADAIALASRAEVFPEPRASRTDLLLPQEEGHSFNHFFPWMVNQDGSELETLNHIGRHELHTYFNRAFDDDTNLDEFICGGNACGRHNEADMLNFLQIRESATEAGLYYGIDAPEFATHAAGLIATLDAPPSQPAHLIDGAWITHSDTATPADAPTPCHSGLYRSPLPLSDGTLVAVHAGERIDQPGVPETRVDVNTNTRAAPASRYRFRLREMTDPAEDGPCEGYRSYGATLTGVGITKPSVTFWDPDVQVTYTEVLMWELDPVEVRSRTAPPAPTATLPAPELAMFVAAGVDPEAFSAALEARGLALIVSRDVTTRDAADRQQPFNLRVPGGTAQTLGASGRIYDVEYMQLFQGDQIRGIHGPATPAPGRRVLAQHMHDGRARNPPLDPGDPPSSVEIADDGSMAALVPAHRAMSWQLTKGDGTPVVRERYWLTFRAGEIRVCASCHGLNDADQSGNAVPVASPQALLGLLQWWKTQLLQSTFEEGDASEWDLAVPAAP